MIWGLNNKPDKEKVVISLTENEVRLFLIENTSNNINVLKSTSVPYDSLEQLGNICLEWTQSSKAKRLSCYWLLSRKLYKTISLVPPKVPDSELDSSIKWLVKDQVEQPIDSLLISQYTPFTNDQDPKKLTAVIVERSLIENIIEITDDIQLNLTCIEISELTPSRTLFNDLKTDDIVGLIDEDKQGLVYNFYIGKKLVFTRHIKGRFFPNQNNNTFTLESNDNDAQTNQFLLETQRTLDYCVSQIFRKPVNRLIINDTKIVNSNLKESLEQITEISVQAYKINCTYLDVSNNTNNEKQLTTYLSIAEAGSALPHVSKKEQQVNLYLPQYHPKPLEFGFKYAAGIVVLFFLGFIGYGIIQEKELQATKERLAIENKSLEKVQNRLKELNKKLGKNGFTENLDLLIIKRERELIASKQLLSKVSNKIPDKKVSYSNVLAALSKQKPDSLWLTQINLSPLTINLIGQTTKPKSIPNYINSMAKNSVLRSQFEGLKIERDKQDSRLVNFTMSNGLYDGVNSNAK